MDTRTRVRDLLLEGNDQELSDEARSTIVDAGPEAIGALVEIVSDDELAQAEAPGGGWAPIHACDLIAELGALEGLPALLGALERSDLLDYLHSHALQAIVDLGPPVVESVLAMHERTSDRELRMSLCEALGKIGVHDDRVLGALLEQLEAQVDFGAGCLADYGDPAALPHLSDAFDAYQPGTDASPMGDQAVIELEDAIESLGGTLTSGQKDKVREVRRQRERYAQRLMGPLDGSASSPAVKRPKIGRNQPCWCGSGKKYKRCHLPEERRTAKR